MGWYKSRKPEHILPLKITMEIQERITNLYSDINNAASDLDGHIQHLIDVAKGK